MKVLLVEDEPVLRSLMTDMLSGFGCDCTVAADGAEGVEAIASGDFGLAVVDMLMPRMNGLDLLRAIRGFDRKPVVVISTAFGSEDHAREAMRLGASDYLRKPVRFPDLAGMVRKYAAVVAARQSEPAAPEGVLYCETHLRLSNHLAKVPGIARYLVGAGLPAGTAEDLPAFLGLNELLQNAIEHGNLGIGGAAKREALAKGATAYDALVEQRRSDTQTADRSVLVRMVATPQFVEWQIEDAGEGFDWPAFATPDEFPDDMLPHGRGIYLCMCYFDELEYLGSGSQVRARRYVAQEQG
jgi:CheY-like chemotaxis protein